MKAFCCRDILRFVLLLFAVIVTTTAAFADDSIASPVPHDSGSTTKAKSSYDKLPLTFEVNEGQDDTAAQFRARCSGYSVELFSGGRLSIDSNSKQPVTMLSSPAQKPSFHVEIQLDGSSTAYSPAGEDKQITRSNYFLGSDRSRWFTNIPHFGRVHYRDVYPGIDVIYYGNQSRLEHDFIVAPGADPAQIAFSVAGASARIDAKTGDLVIPTAQGDFRLLKPVSYQQIGAQRIAVQSGYRILAKNRVGFSIGGYGHNRPLIIDPELSYSTYLYGRNSELYESNAIAVDAAGNAYLAGRSSVAGPGISIMKITPGGSEVVYYTYIGPPPNDTHASSAMGIAVDKTGAAYIAGWTQWPDFPTVNPIQRLLKSMCSNAVIFKLSPDGSKLIYSTFLGGSANVFSMDPASDYASGIALDSAGHAYITGVTVSSDFPVSHAIQDRDPSPLSAFVAELSPTGSQLEFSTYLGGSLATYGAGIAVDGSGDIFVTGTTTSTDFPTWHPFQSSPKPNSGENAFVTAFAPHGANYLYSTFLGGSSGSNGAAVAVDTKGNAYVTGSAGPDFPTTAGAFLPEDPDGLAAFVAKFDPSGSSLVYGTYLGGQMSGFGGTTATGIAVDNEGRAIVGGYTYDLDFPVTPDAFQNHGPFSDCEASGAFLSEFDASGATLRYSTYMSGADLYYGSMCFSPGPIYVGNGVASDSMGNAYLTGTASWFGFPTTPYALATQGYYGGGFASKFALGRFTQTATTIAANPNPLNAEVSFTASVKSIGEDAVPRGNIGFFVDGAPVADIAVGGTGEAVFRTSTLSKGSHSVKAVYSGAVDYDASDASIAIVTAGQTTAPVFTPRPASYASTQTVQIIDRTRNAVIYYTTDGSTPTVKSTRYTAAIKVTHSETIKAIATSPFHYQSEISIAEYILK